MISPALLSIVVPVLDEEAQWSALWRNLQPWVACGVEVLVVDGGSRDQTVTRVEQSGVRCLHSPVGRARQQQTGAQVAQGQWLLFHHADSRLPDQPERFLRTLGTLGHEIGWGFFVPRLSGPGYGLRCIERMMQWRSRWTRIATGDQSIFVRRDYFEQIGGIPQQALMEDLALCDRLRRQGRPLIWPAPVVTSSRRWEERGVLRTVLQMWWLRALYRLGASPQWLCRQYYPGRTWHE